MADGGMIAIPEMTAPAVDAVVLNELQALLGEDFDHLVATFLRDLDAKRASLMAARRAHDLAALSEQSHSLKGAARNVGASRLAALGEALERDGRRGVDERLDELLVQLAEEANRVRRALDGARCK